MRYQRFAHGSLANADDGVFLAARLCGTREAELIHEKFFKDKPLLRRRAKVSAHPDFPGSGKWV